MTKVTAELREGIVATLRARQHVWKADEPESAGGMDAGPNPYELLLGALAACTAITLRLYARHKGLELQGVDVTLELDRVHAEDCTDCEIREDGLIERIRSQVTIHGSFDEAQRRRLAQVAQRCPVHKTLARRTHFVDSVAFETNG